MSNATNDAGHEIPWDGVIEKDSPDYVLQPEGDYDFEAIEFERARHPGSEKLPACNKAIIHIKVESALGVTLIRHNLFLHSRTEGMLCAFFKSIGQRKKDEKATMNWNAVPGSKGRAKVGIRKYTNDDGKEIELNEIKKFYDPAETVPAASKTFEAGRF